MGRLYAVRPARQPRIRYHLPVLHVKTPLLRFVPVGAQRGPELHFKLESVQPTGSFKIRGIGHLCELARERGFRSLVASSGGNAGLAVAYAGARLGMPATVVVPTTTPERMRGLVRAHGAEVVVAGDVWDRAHDAATALAYEDGGFYVPPFDHPEIWTGHATLIEELGEQIAEPDWIVVAVGGGGLLGGVLVGLDAVGWARTRVLAVETEGAASFAAAMRAGCVVDIERIESVAKSLGARRVSEGVLGMARDRGVECELVGDDRAVAAACRFLDEQRLLVEPACGAALAAAYEWKREPSTVVVIACGGAGITADELRTLSGRFS